VEKVAGRELDTLVAEKVMGSLRPTEPGLFCGEPSDDGKWWWESYQGDTDISKWAPPEYSTSISAAWEVVEKLLHIGLDFTIDSGRDRTTGEVFHSCRIDDINLTYADTAPHAICLAALKAVGEG